MPVMDISNQDGPVLAIHGGAGTLRPEDLPPAREQAYRQALADILADGQRRLARGDAALAIAVEAVRRLEECELFNAGKGAVYTSAATHELDASVMDGRDRRAGAVAGLSRVRNPVLAAQAVMAHSGHVMLIGAAAEDFAADQGLELVAPDWFGTPLRRAQLAQARAQALGVRLDHDVAAIPASAQDTAPLDERNKLGTVGAVVRDAQGHVAAATSTGGMTNKRPGRVGDSPLIGAGCYADDRSVAVSCTGTGEAFMRAVAAHELAALVRLGGMSLAQAMQRLLVEELPQVQGQGGLIAVDARGHICLGFNTAGMYRGWVRPGLAPRVGIYREEASPA